MTSHRRSPAAGPDYAPLSADWRAFASGWAVSTVLLALLVLGA